MSAPTSTASGIPGPEVGYVDLLNHATVEASKEVDPKEFHPLRPSSSGKCTRELYHDLRRHLGKGEYKTIEKKAEVSRLLDLGHFIESHLLRQFEKRTPYIKTRYKQQVLTFYRLEAKNHPELSHMVEGSLDTCFWNEQFRAVVDFKSKKDKFSSWYSNNWDETSGKLARMPSVVQISENAFWVDDLPAFLAALNDPFFEANFLQLNGYACTEFLKERGVDHGVLIQSNKNDSRLREIRFRPSQALFDKVRAKFQAALDAVDQDNEALAPKDYALGSFKCAFCDHAPICWGEDTLKAWFKTFPGKQWPTDLAKLGEVGGIIEKHLSDFAAFQQESDKAAIVEQEVVKLMEQQQLTKVRTSSGEVYEAKFLKTPKPHVEIRRSKA